MMTTTTQTASQTQTIAHVGCVQVAGWGSDRHAREVRAGRATASLRAIIAAHDTVTADTDRGLRRLIVRRGQIYTRMPAVA